MNTSGLIPIQTQYNIPGPEQSRITFDVTLVQRKQPQPLILFCHGFKGFKDYGAWNQMAEFIALQGFICLKMNFSHNGVSPNDLTDLSDEKSFSKNTISLELKDIDLVLSWIEDKNSDLKDYFNGKVFAIGHSRGATTLLIKTLNDSRINALAMWAPAADFSRFVEDPDHQWSKLGYRYILNQRTGQKWKLNYGFVEDYLEHESELDPKRNIAKFDKPLFIVHGTEDETTSIEDSRTMFNFVQHAVMIELEGAGHTFGSAHPWVEEEMPEFLHEAVEETLEFFLM